MGLRRLSGGMCLCVAAALACLWPSPAGAELVVLVDNRVLKVTRYRVLDERVEMELPSGGTLTLPIGRIERVVDDEIVPEEELVMAVETPARAALRFQHGDPVPGTPYGELIFEAARRHSLSPALVAAVVQAESAFDAAAVSRKGARGLMQLMPATADRFGIEPAALFDPEPNLEAGTRYLAWLRGRFDDDLPRILAAYNAGEANVDRYGGMPPFRETRNYVDKIYRQLGLSAGSPAGE